MQDRLTAPELDGPSGDRTDVTDPAGGLSQVLVTGFLGTGKSRVAAALTGEQALSTSEHPFQARTAGLCPVPGGGPATVIEGSPFQVPAAAPGQLVLATVDAVNATRNLADPDLKTLVAGQIRAADMVVLTCGDVADPAHARQAIAALTDAPVLEAHAEEDLAGAMLSRSTRRAAPAPAAEDHSAAFTVWSYSGSAVLTNEAMVAFVAGRPAGAYRVKATVMLHEGGGEIDVFGRGRRTWAIERPAATQLAVAGPASRLSRREIDLAFAEAVATAAYGRGVIACR